MHMNPLNKKLNNSVAELMQKNILSSQKTHLEVFVLSLFTSNGNIIVKRYKNKMKCIR